nr:MAG TPA: hypothetical protein [Caudoviricetes sp.]
MRIGLSGRFGSAFIGHHIFTIKIILSDCS